MAAARPASLWLALRFFRLPLEIAGPQDGPAVVAEQHHVLCANAAAEAAGVVPGLRLAGALGMAPGLRVLAREADRERAALAQLACWAGGFTPEVCLAGADELLLEIGGCLRLFDGLERLLTLIRDGLAAQDYSFVTALAATPLAAQWCVRGGGEEDRGGQSTPLRERLAALPVGVLDLNAREARTLAALGAHRLGDLFALPAAGLARRFGPALPLRLAQALGEVPDPRPRFVFPERFALRLELPAKVEHSAMLLFAARRLLASLAGWLAQRVAGVHTCELRLLHDEGAVTPVALAFAGATRDLARFERVLRERLDRLVLAAPVYELELQAAEPVAAPGRDLGLFAQPATESLEPVVERLRARLGEDAVHGLAVRAEHRPECATRALRPGEAGAPDVRPGPPRPLWLLARPRPLRERDGTLHDRAPLQRVAGPERIESGWWDAGERGAAGDMTRDYYVAISADGEWLWVYRDAQGWWVHGLFA